MLVMTRLVPDSRVEIQQMTVHDCRMIGRKMKEKEKRNLSRKPRLSGSIASPLALSTTGSRSILTPNRGTNVVFR